MQAQDKEEQQIKADTKVISAQEFEEYLRFKEQATSKYKETSRDLSINERITKELAEVEERERVEKQLLLETKRINKIWEDLIWNYLMKIIMQKL
ncbi:conserved hypothetical protein (plasmid) [Borreliella bissettiae DN127]|uniref:Uncharacterized protein n=1 Tax=Borrelia bissettiae (strain DSM 17990 / CIP 109136 / DN127) TaxID=521010 RepID=G0ANT8_BORBD|nr:conserved hypothetical protein [Borreliella bissettiae DN127]